MSCYNSIKLLHYFFKMRFWLNHLIRSDQSMTSWLTVWHHHQSPVWHPPISCMTSPISCMTSPPIFCMTSPPISCMTSQDALFDVTTNLLYDITTNLLYDITMVFYPPIVLQIWGITSSWLICLSGVEFLVLFSGICGFIQEVPMLTSISLSHWSRPLLRLVSVFYSSGRICPSYLANILRLRLVQPLGIGNYVRLHSSESLSVQWEPRCAVRAW